MPSNEDTVREFIAANPYPHERAHYLAALDALVAELDRYAMVLGNLKGLAEAEIESNPALGIPGYRKGMLARAVAALGEDA